MKDISNSVLLASQPSENGSLLLASKLLNRSLKFTNVRPAKGAKLSDPTNEKNKYSFCAFVDNDTNESIGFSLMSLLSFQAEASRDIKDNQKQNLISELDKNDVFNIFIKDVRDTLDKSDNKIYPIDSYKEFITKFKLWKAQKENLDRTRSDFFLDNPDIRELKSSWTLTDPDAQCYQTCTIVIEHI